MHAAAAVDDLARATRLAPGRAGYHVWHARALAAWNRRAEALEACEAALALNPEHTEALALLADLGRPRSEGGDRTVDVKPESRRSYGGASALVVLAIAGAAFGWLWLRKRKTSAPGQSAPRA
jgi:hypothetical protein